MFMNGVTIVVFIYSVVCEIHFFETNIMKMFMSYYCCVFY